MFQANIVSRVQYVILDWGGFPTADFIQQIDAFSFEQAKLVPATASLLLVYCLLLIKLCLTLFVNLSMVSTQLRHLSKALSIICMSEVMNISSKTLEYAYTQNLFFCVFYIKLFNLIQISVMFILIVIVHLSS
jgi:hypothetical protein